MSIKELQTKLLQKIAGMLLLNDPNNIETSKQQALDIIKNELKDDINAITEFNGKTILDLIHKRGLPEIEKAILDLGGKTSQELVESKDSSEYVKELNRRLSKIVDRYIIDLQKIKQDHCDLMQMNNGVANIGGENIVVSRELFQCTLDEKIKALDVIFEENGKGAWDKFNEEIKELGLRRCLENI